MGCSPWGRSESNTTERLPFHFSLSCIGEGNGNPLQCSCRENPRDGGAWWAAVCGVAQSRTRLKRLSSSSSSRVIQGGQFITVQSAVKGVDHGFVHHLFRVWSGEEGGLLEGREVSGGVGGKPGEACVRDIKEGASDLLTDKVW